MRRVVVTGANGFIGRRLCAFLVNQGVEVKGVVRQPSLLLKGVEPFFIPDLTLPYDSEPLLKGVDTLFHLASQAHAVKGGKLDSGAYETNKLKAINVDATLFLAKAALKAGVRRFVYLSSIKVNGNSSKAVPFSEESPVIPEDNYGESKRQAETQLFQLTEKTSLELVIIRSPLVYGPGVKGNFLDLLRLCHTSWRLPFASITNQRSFIYVENLVSALFLCGTHPQARGKIFMVRDGQDISTPQLIRTLKTSMHLPLRLFPCPLWLLRGITTLLGRQAAFHRLTDSLQVNDQRIRQMLHWQPPFTLEQGLQETVSWFVKNLD